MQLKQEATRVIAASSGTTSRLESSIGHTWTNVTMQHATGVVPLEYLFKFFISVPGGQFDLQWAVAFKNKGQNKKHTVQMTSKRDMCHSSMII